MSMSKFTALSRLRSKHDQYTPERADHVNLIFIPMPTVKFIVSMLESPDHISCKRDYINFADYLGFTSLEITNIRSQIQLFKYGSMTGEILKQAVAKQKSFLDVLTFFIQFQVSGIDKIIESWPETLMNCTRFLASRFRLPQIPDENSWNCPNSEVSQNDLSRVLTEYAESVYSDCNNEHYPTQYSDDGNADTFDHDAPNVPGNAAYTYQCLISGQNSHVLSAILQNTHESLPPNTALRIPEENSESFTSNSTVSALSDGGQQEPYDHEQTFSKSFVTSNSENLQASTRVINKISQSNIATSPQLEVIMNNLKPLSMIHKYFIDGNNNNNNNIGITEYCVEQNAGRSICSGELFGDGTVQKLEEKLHPHRIRLVDKDGLPMGATCEDHIEFIAPSTIGSDAPLLPNSKTKFFLVALCGESASLHTVEQLCKDLDKENIVYIADFPGKVHLSRVDQEEMKSNYTLWVKEKFAQATGVLMVVSKTYHDYVHKNFSDFVRQFFINKDHGYQHQTNQKLVYNLMKAEINVNGNKNKRFLPVLINDAKQEDIPRRFRSSLIYYYKPDSFQTSQLLVELKNRLKSCDL